MRISDWSSDVCSSDLHYVRERGLLTLEEAVAKMTGQTAAVLGLAERGMIRSGHHADLVLFDPATVIDRASYDDPAVPAAGIDCVQIGRALCRARVCQYG